MPIIEDMLNAAGTSRWFCLIDLRSAYWQIPMSPDSICKTLFSTKSGHYEILRLSFGLMWVVFNFSVEWTKSWCQLNIFAEHISMTC